MDVEEYLEERDKLALRDRDPLRIWGNLPGTRKGWADMELGDIVLFYQSGKFTHAGKVYHKIDNEALSKRLWPDYEKGKPWRYIYFLQEIKEVDVPWTLVKQYSKYNSGFVLRGFTSLRPEGMDAIIRDYGSAESFVKAPEITSISTEPASKNWWVEKSIVKDRPERVTGKYSLGKALWSPQKRSDGRDIYKNMREIEKGDIVLHLVDNRAIVGISIVDKEYESTPYEDRDHARGPGYLVTLRDYQKFDPPIDRSDILNAKYRGRLLSILRNGHYVFYNTKLNLNQGAYLTEAPPPLIEIINEAYKEKTGKDLPYIETTENHYTFRLTEEDFEACRKSKKTNYIEPVYRKFENTLKPELIRALGKDFEDLVTGGRHPSPYVARMWTRRGGGHYRDHMWIGFALLLLTAEVPLRIVPCSLVHFLEVSGFG